MAEFLSSDPKVQDAHPHTVYDLVASICHDGKAGAGKGTYRVHLRHKVPGDLIGRRLMSD